MKPPAPVYHVKRKARLLPRKDNIALHTALDCVAVDEGFSSWSILAGKIADEHANGLCIAQDYAES